MREQAAELGKTITASKWVYKIKNEGEGKTRYKLCDVSKGYMQIPGINYTKQYSLVANSTTTRMLIPSSLESRQEMDL